MPKLKNYRAVDAEYATNGPNTATLCQKIEAPAADVFRCLADGPAWKEWLGIDVEWTSEPPFGVGTTRTVTANRQVIEEYFLVWEDGRRFAFRFDRATLPLSAFAEDYLVVELSDRSCELRWSYAFEWRGPLAKVAAPVFGRLFAMNGRRALAKLADLVESSGDRFAG